MDDEWLDLVDDEDRVVGRISRRDSAARGVTHVRVINAFLRNSQGAIWIPTRTLHKKMFPGCFDFSVGGYVSAGEDYDTAFRRELREELNIEASACVWRRLATLSPLQHPVQLFEAIYEISTDVTPDYNREDFSEAIWINPNDLMLKLSHGAPQKTDLLPVVRLCYGEQGGPKGPEPTRYGDWEQRGRCTDF